MKRLPLLAFFLTAHLVCAAPRLTCDAPKYDFGTRMNSEKITHRFTLKNRGKDPVKIFKIKNCCGVKSSISPMEILPGSNAVCTVVFSTKNRYGKQDKQILIASNDRKHPYFELKLVGTLLRPIECTPRFIRLGTLYPDSSISQIITATNQTNSSIDLQTVTSTIPEINAEIITAKDRNWIIKLHSIAPLKKGRLSGKIQLHFSSDIVNILLFGTVKSSLQIVPKQIQFSPSSSKTIERLVMIRSGENRPFKVLSATIENGEGSVEIKKLTASRWQCRLRLNPTSLQPHAILRIATTCKAQPQITIPLILLK